MEVLLTGILFCSAAGPSHAQVLPGQFISQTGANNPLDGEDVGIEGKPAFVDIDNDGDLDLFVGEDSGIIFYYENTGSVSSPIYTQRTGASNPMNEVAAGSVAAFGLVNAVMILGSAACMATAINVAGDASLALGDDPSGTIQLLNRISSNLWGVGSVFFGLWLIPMGYIASESGRMPKPLGLMLMVGGVGYVLSALLGYGFSDLPTWLSEGLTIPASIGEFWMIGYLLSVGIRSPEPEMA